MADNYLEKKMEDLRSGRLSAPPKGSSQRQTTRPAPAGRLAGLRAVVTGGANGIGRQIVAQFRRDGASVDFIDIDSREGNAAAQLLGARFHHVDIADTETFESCLKSIIALRGDIDIFVNNAAIADFCTLEENSAGRFLRSMEVNVVPALVAARIISIHRDSLPSPNPYGGRIINIISTRATMSEASTECYSASKGALASLSHALMMSLSRHAITVNCISPGWIDTSDGSRLSPADHLQHPSRRVGKPLDVARVCSFLALPGNDFINGDVITVDGGMTRRMIYTEDSSDSNC